MPLSKYKLAWSSTVIRSHFSSIQPLSKNRLAKLKGLWRWHDHHLHCAGKKRNPGLLGPHGTAEACHPQKHSQFYLNLEVISNQNKTIINTALINKFTNNSSHMTGSMEIKCFTVCVSRTALEQDWKVSLWDSELWDRDGVRCSGSTIT